MARISSLSNPCFFVSRNGQILIGGKVHEGISGITFVNILGVCTWYCVHSSLMCSILGVGSPSGPITAQGSLAGFEF